MDIYGYAKINNTDYMDTLGNIYRVQDYNRALDFGLAPEGGEFIGIAKKKED